MTRRVVVTGGAGFIGRHVVTTLEALGTDLIVADRRPHATATSAVGDLLDEGAVERAVPEGTDAVVHLAAATSVLGSIQRPVETYRNNVGLTAALLERCRVIGVPTVVMASTNAVVGGGFEPGKSINERSPLVPLTPYGATKAAAEMLLSSYTAAFGVRGVALRLTNVYGTGMSEKDSIVARLMRAAESGATFEVYGDGKQVRDYVWAGDVAAAVVLALDTDVSGPVIIGSGQSTSVLDLLDMARAATGRELPVRHVPPKAGEMAGVDVDTSRARSLGWSPSIDLPQGLAEVWAAWRPVPAGT